MLRVTWRGLLANGVRPWTPAAAFVVLGSVALATLLRMFVGLVGRGEAIPFAAFFPAVLISALLGGPVTGAVSALLSLVVVWFVFMGGAGAIPTAADVTTLAMFGIASAVIIWLADAFRRMQRDYRRQQRQFELLTREMEHRGKNTFAVVEAIVFQSLEGDRDKAEAIAGRIQAVSSTNDIITSMDGNAAPLHAILESKLKTFLPRTTLSGSEVLLSPQVARALGLVLHELVVNAIKYGAFRSGNGHVDVTWAEREDGVDLEWKETSAEPIAPPNQPGFGTRLVTRMMRGIGGSVEAEFPPAGMICTLYIPRPRP